MADFKKIQQTDESKEVCPRVKQKVHRVGSGSESQTESTVSAIFEKAKFKLGLSYLSQPSPGGGGLPYPSLRRDPLSKPDHPLPKPDHPLP